MGPDGILSPEKPQLFEAYANLSVLALERICLSTQVHQAQLLEAKEEFQSDLLDPIPHELRTPSVTITGTLSSLDKNIKPDTSHPMYIGTETGIGYRLKSIERNEI